jgi:hypothetical protein
VKAIVAALVCLLVGIELVHAQSDGKSPVDNFNHYSLDFAVPESPAFTLLGLSQPSVIHPTSIRDFGASLVNGVSSGGQLQTGIAIDTAPYLLVAGNDLTLADYQNNRVTRLLANTQLSLATTKADGESGNGTRVGVGLHMKLYDLGDPRRKGNTVLTDCYAKASADFNDRPALPVVPPGLSEDEKKKRQEARDKAIAAMEKGYQEPFAACYKRARQELWNRSNWLVGVASAWTNDGNVTDSMRSGGGALWTTYAYGFEGVKALERYSQLLLHVRLQDDEVVASKDSATGFFRRDSVVLGTRFRLGSEAGTFLIEASQTRGDLENGQSEKVRRAAIGGEVRISKDVWLVGSIGGESGFSDGTKNNFVLGGLKFGSASEPQFGSSKK